MLLKQNAFCDVEQIWTWITIYQYMKFSTTLAAASLINREPPTEWTPEQDITLCRELLLVNPFKEKYKTN